MRREPPRVGETTEICATVINSDPEQAKPVVLIFEVAELGTGVPLYAVDAVDVEVPPGCVSGSGQLRLSLAAL